MDGMIRRSTVVLLSCVASVAWAGNDTTRSIADVHAKDGRTLVARHPVVAATAVPPAAPLDRSPIPAYPAGAPGSAQTISGQCFVVTDGGQKIILSRVDVGIYPQREFEWYAQEVTARSKARFEGMKSLACPPNFAALSLPEMDRSLAAATVLQRDLHVVWQVLPAADASTKTDADGRFSITHQVAPPYIVFATGSRTSGGETEYYQWQIASSTITNPSAVELSNPDLR